MLKPIWGLLTIVTIFGFLTPPLIAKSPSKNETFEVRRDPGVALRSIEAFERKLGCPLEERHAQARASLLMFFRMYPHVFFEDLRGPFRQLGKLSSRPSPSIRVQGDCHIGNFGTLRGRSGVLWSLNDFDGACQGGPELDLTRMATSLVLVGGSVETMLEHYRVALAGEPVLEVGLGLKEARGPVLALLRKASRKTQAELMADFTRGGRLKRNGELQSISPELRAELESRVGSCQDICAKLHSGGSTLGLHRYYALQGEVLLEIKELLGPAPGGFTLKGRQFLVREREREKAALKVEDWDEEVAGQAGTVLAQSHARSRESAQALLTWLGDGKEAAVKLREFAAQYAAQVKLDHEAYR